MKAAPHEQLDYLTHTDPAFAKASPQDQMEYLMHIRGLSPSISGPAGPKTDMQYSLLGNREDQFPTKGSGRPSKLSTSIPGSFEGSYSSNDQDYGKFMTTAGLSAGAALLGGRFGPTIVSGAAKVAAKHPIATMAAIEAAKQLPGTAGKIAQRIPSWLPLFAGGEPAVEPGTPPPPIRWNPEAEPTPAGTPPPPLRWNEKAPAQALEDIKAAAAESPYKVVELQGAKAPATQGANPLSGPRAPAQMEEAQSTTIQSHGYHGDSQTMTVQFKNGNVYQLRGVPQKVYQQYQQSESQGSFYANNLKGRYQTRLVGKVGATPGQQAKDALSGGQQ